MGLWQALARHVQRVLSWLLQTRRVLVPVAGVACISDMPAVACTADGACASVTPDNMPQAAYRLPGSGDTMRRRALADSVVCVLINVNGGG